MLITGLEIRTIKGTTGELLRALTLDYQPTGNPRGKKRSPP
jgi:hypothetical protein